MNIVALRFCALVLAVCASLASAQAAEATYACHLYDKSGQMLTPSQGTYYVVRASDIMEAESKARALATKQYGSRIATVECGVQPDRNIDE